jgi:hypothetical protein
MTDPIIFSISWNLDWFILGCFTSAAMELINLRKGTRNFYQEKIIGGTSVIDDKKISIWKIIYTLLYVPMGGFFVMLLNPGNILAAIVVGAAWDSLLVKNVEKVLK